MLPLRAVAKSGNRRSKTANSPSPVFRPSPDQAHGHHASIAGRFCPQHNCKHTACGWIVLLNGIPDYVVTQSYEKNANAPIAPKTTNIKATRPIVRAADHGPLA